MQPPAPVSHPALGMVTWRACYPPQMDEEGIVGATAYSSWGYASINLGFIHWLCQKGHSHSKEKEAMSEDIGLPANLRRRNGEPFVPRRSLPKHTKSIRVATGHSDAHPVDCGRAPWHSTCKTMQQCASCDLKGLLSSVLECNGDSDEYGYIRLFIVRR